MLGIVNRYVGIFILYYITRARLISLFNVIPVDFNAPVPVLHKFFLIPLGKKLFASLTNFAPRKFLERIVTADEI
jgi:hypothetical protein